MSTQELTYSEAFDLASIYAPRVPLGARLRGLFTALDRGVENLPPFWLTFVYIAAVSVQPAALVLPIALAVTGPLLGIAALLLIAAVNILTMVCMAEAVARSGAARYGRAFLGALAADYLGSAAAGFVAQVTLVRTFLLILTPILALSTTMASFTGLRAELWALLLLVFVVQRLYRQVNGFDVSTLAVLGAINVALLVTLSLIALTHLRGASLSLSVPLLPSGSAGGVPELGMVCGVLMGCYTGHLPLLRCARVVLRRSPDGRCLISGSIAATAFVTALFCLWIVAVNGALPGHLLAGEHGTVLSLLAARFGAPVAALGGGFACLILGRGALGQAEILFCLVREKLPVRVAHIVKQGPGSGSRVLAPGPRRLTPLVRKLVHHFLFSKNGSFLPSASPTLLAFLLCLGLLLAGTASVTQVTSVVGILGLAFSGGIFPLLLLVASRRKGEITPGRVLPFLDHPVVAAGIYLFFIAMLLLHGLVLWKAPLARAAALGTAGVILASTALFARRGAFARRAVIELREEEDGRAVFAVTVEGRPLAATVELEYPNGRQTCRSAAGEVPGFASLQAATFSLPATPARELKVWVHRVTPEHDSQPLPALAEVDRADEARRVDLGLCHGRALISIPSAACQVRLTFPARHPAVETTAEKVRSRPPATGEAPVREGGLRAFSAVNSFAGLQVRLGYGISARMGTILDTLPSYHPPESSKGEVMQHPEIARETAISTAMNELWQGVQALIDGDLVVPADGQSLLAILEAALEALAAGDAPAARARAEEFAERAQAMVESGLAEPRDARLQIEAAAAIVAALSGQGSSREAHDGDDRASEL